jgi:hypothetical protein
MAIPIVRRAAIVTPAARAAMVVPRVGRKVAPVRAAIRARRTRAVVSDADPKHATNRLATTAAMRRAIPSVANPVRTTLRLPIAPLAIRFRRQVRRLPIRRAAPTMAMAHKVLLVPAGAAGAADGEVALMVRLAEMVSRRAATITRHHRSRCVFPREIVAFAGKMARLVTLCRLGVIVVVLACRAGPTAVRGFM